MFVKMRWLAKTLFVTVLLCCQQSCGADSDGSVSVGRNAFVSKIAETLSVTTTDNAGKTVFTFNALKNLWHALGFLNCSVENIAGNCQRCIEISDLYNFNNKSVDALITSEQFQGLLPSIIYFLLPVNSSAPCNITDVKTKKQIPTERPVTVPNVYSLLVQGYGEDKSTLHEESIDVMLEKINSSINHLLTNKMCFDVDEVIEDSAVSAASIPPNDFEYVSAYIIWKLLEKHCIAKHVPTLPSKEFFADQLVAEFGTDGVITFAKFEELVKKLKIGSASTTDEHNHNRRRRSVDDQIPDESEPVTGATAVLKRSRRSTAVQSTAFATRCYTPENIFQIYGYSQSIGVNKTQFTQLCPALIQQIESGTCAQTTTTGTMKQTDWKPWVAALISVSIISLTSLVGIIAAPLNRKSYFSRILTTFIALGVGTLLGDAILHLLPHALGLHGHEGAEHVDVKSSGSFVWKALVFIAGVYAFYLFEAVMHSFSQHGHSHGLEDTHKHLGRMPSHSKQVKGGIELNAQIESEEKNKTLLDRAQTALLTAEKPRHLVNTPSGVHQCESAESLPNIEIVQNGAKPAEMSKEVMANGKVSHVKSVIANMKSVVGMILFGDALHNFVDGVAIGVVFTEAFPNGLYGGISTSVAILCHEIPHELGDLAILLSSGMSIKTALILNFISSLTAIIGACVGVAAGQQLSALPWIFAVTAGLFVYIALVDMLPELLHSSDLRKNPGIAIFLQSLGMLSGFAVMTMLALYEEEIKVKA